MTAVVYEDVTERRKRAKLLLEALWDATNEDRRVAVIMQFEEAQYQRGFKEGYELGQEPAPPPPTPRKNSPLRKVQS